MMRIADSENFQFSSCAEADDGGDDGNDSDIGNL